MRVVGLLFAGLIAFSGAAYAATSKDWAECGGDNIERAISACSKIIAQGKESGPKLALAYADRGKAYVDKGDYDRAIADLDEAIKSDRAPQYDWALVYSAGHGIEVGGVNYVPG